MRLLDLLVVLAVGLLLFYGILDFPEWADPYSPASTHVSPHYITKTIEETAVPNAVTSILADYRGFDTMFETTVIFTAGIAVVLILRRRKTEKETEPQAEVSETLIQADIIVRTVVRILIPFIQLFALYVIAHGHHSPGGGFQGGVILGASFILLAISYELQTSLQRMKEKKNWILSAVGVLIYSGIGAICIVLGGNFLDYGALHKILPATDSIMARSHGILGVEIGVGIAVMSIMIMIFFNLSSGGKFKRGL